MLRNHILKISSTKHIDHKQCSLLHLLCNLIDNFSLMLSIAKLTPWCQREEILKRQGAAQLTIVKYLYCCRLRMYVFASNKLFTFSPAKE